MKGWSYGVICVVAALLMGSQAHAQQCPAGITNPLQLLDGTTWTFSTRSANVISNGDASVGFFKPKFVPTNSFDNQGVLTITETVDQIMTLGQVTRLAHVSGRYQVYADCSGGELMFMLSNQSVQFEFVFANNFSEIYMMSDSITTPALQAQVQGFNEILVGTAVRM
jgi:hypothetical protein